MKVNIEGYGQFDVKIPKKEHLSDKRIKRAVMDAVVSTVNLLESNSQKERWHPAVGKGGYSDAFSKPKAPTQT